MRTLRGLVKVLLVVWASPYTLIGLTFGGIGLLGGSRVQLRRGVIEFHGGLVRFLLRRLPIGGGGAAAMTLGHCILGQTVENLDRSRDHEHVHVRQFERWGPLMGPLYLGGSLYALLRRERPYRDNPFEREAYDADERCVRERRDRDGAD